MSSNQKGQTFIEMLVAIVVVIVVALAMTYSAINSIRNTQFAQDQAQATKFAQEGLERVKSGRDRNAAIANLSQYVSSWNGVDSFLNQSIWGYQINGTCGNSQVIPPINCYFNADLGGNLNYLTSSDAIPSNAEPLGKFKRIVVLTDDAGSFGNQKTVTVVVEWADYSGKHQSKLTTILGKP